MPPKKRGRPSAFEKKQKILRGLFKNETKVYHKNAAKVTEIVIDPTVMDKLQRNVAAKNNKAVAPPDEEDNVKVESDYINHKTTCHGNTSSLHNQITASTSQNLTQFVDCGETIKEEIKKGGKCAVS